MIVVAVVVALAVVAAAVTGARRAQTRAAGHAELDRFAAASAVTGRWAHEPGSAPKPVLDIAGAREPDAADGHVGNSG